MIGRIKYYNENKGYGFIFGSDENDYFFHISNYKAISIPQRGNVVKFQKDSNEKGLFAKNVKYLAENNNEYERMIKEQEKENSKIQLPSALETPLEVLLTIMDFFD